MATKNDIKRRRLPDWMSEVNNANNPDLNEVFQRDLCPLAFGHPPIYSWHRDDCDLLCDDLLESLEEDKREYVYGFDMEWPVTYTKGCEDRTAVLQLCISPTKCYIFQLSNMGELPPLLQKVLLHPLVKLTGIGIESDLWKLARDFNIDVRPIVRMKMIDLSYVANQILNTSERWSLENLTKHLLKKKLNKEPSIRKSDWRTYPLSEVQLMYAATDAFACLQIYQELKSKEKS